MHGTQACLLYNFWNTSSKIIRLWVGVFCESWHFSNVYDMYEQMRLLLHMLLLGSPSVWIPLSTLIGLLKIWVLIFMSLGPCYAACSVMRLFVLKEIAGEMGWSASWLLLYSEVIWLSWDIRFYTYLSEEKRQTSPFFLFLFFLISLKQSLSIGGPGVPQTTGPPPTSVSQVPRLLLWAMTHI